MRKATIEIFWMGPDKPIRALIEDGLDRLFEEMTEHPKLVAAHTTIDFKAKAETARNDGSESA